MWFTYTQKMQNSFEELLVTLNEEKQIILFTLQEKMAEGRRL